MRGLVRPCRHQLSADLRERWRSHLCGLCLTLRKESGQAARLLTGYDVLLLSVLVEAQTGRVATEAAGPCPLRGMRTATVVAADSPAMQVAAAGTLLTGAAGLEDKLLDGDLPVAARGLARRARSKFAVDGGRLAERAGLDPAAVQEAALAAQLVEADPDATLEDLLAPSGGVVAELFAATADTAGCPENRRALRRAGDAFGRLVHLGDALDDLERDHETGAFNPLLATHTSRSDAAALAQRLHAEITAALQQAELPDRELLDELLGPVLARTVRRWQPVQVSAQAARGSGGFAMAAMTSAAAVSSAAVAMAGVFGGRPPRRRGRFGGGYGGGYGGYDPRFDPAYGRRYRRGPGCCDVLACDCCASLACSEICGDDCCVCCV